MRAPGRRSSQALSRRAFSFLDQEGRRTGHGGTDPGPEPWGQEVMGIILENWTRQR